MDQLSPYKIHANLIEGCLLLRRVSYQTYATGYSGDIVFSHSVEQHDGG